MTEPTLGLIYRLALIALLGLIVVLRPDSFREWAPIIVGLLTSGLATGNTRLRR